MSDHELDLAALPLTLPGQMGIPGIGEDLTIHPMVICADPPWRFEDDLPGPKRGASSHYPCMSVRDICRMQIPRPAKNCVLFLWRVASMQQEAIDVAEAWGFEVRSELVWVKRTRKSKRFFGMGHYVRMEHEVCLICVRGSASPAVHNIRSVFEAPVGVHSAKPAKFYQLVREMYPHSRKVEMFARTVRKDFEQHGNELGKLGTESDGGDTCHEGAYDQEGS